MHGVHLYVDLDQVIADFDEGYYRAFGTRPSKAPGAVDWARVAGVANFYQTLPLMTDALDLWAHVRHRNPIILTGRPVSVPSAEADKKAWVARHLGEDVRCEVTLSAYKWRYAQPGDILVDDWPKYQDLWERAGGVWITHTSAANSIEQLKERGL